MFALIHDVLQKFKYRNIHTEELVAFVNQQLGSDLTPVFDQYLRRTDLAILELAFNEAEGTVAYRWKADERAFNMPVKVGDPSAWQMIRPTTEWQVMKTVLKKDTFAVATDLFYVDVRKQ